MPGPASSKRVWPAPAKLNLFLHVVGRRADGYHELQTLFQFLDWGDDLQFSVRPDGAITRARPLEGVAESQDLTVRAAQLLREHSGCRLGCEIHLVKRIPRGAGLGGGSSDAATTLVALNRLWNLNLPDTELAALGLRLGADVPVFVHGHAAWAEGIGEQLTPAAPPEAWYLVITPDCVVETAGMYQDPDLPRATKRVKWEDYAAGRCHNDFTAVARRRYPPVARALDWAARLGVARLSGSGASVFVDFAARDEAERACAQVPAPWHAVVASGCNRSPLRVG